MHSLAALAREEVAGEDPLVLDGQDPAWVQAEAFRKNGDFERAGPYFFEQWTQGQQSAAGWRYAYCLRKAGHPEAALRVAYKVVSAYPEEQPAVREKVWSLYEARLKPALENQRHQQVLQIAEQMVQAGADSFALKVAVFAGMRAAKESRQWEKVLDWCSQIDPRELSNAPKKLGERKSLSDRERFYYARIKAYVQLGRWEEALVGCEKALADFDRNQDFVRWKAQSLAALGDLEPAIDLLQALRGGRARWYVLVDLARLLLQAQRLDEAWAVALEATRAPVEDNHKLGLYEVMARVALQQGRQACAVDHVGWCLALREHEKWSKGAALEELELQLCHAVDNWLPYDPAHWRDRATLHWGLTAPSSPGPRDQSKQQGVIEQFMVNRNYCFVLSQGQRYYTLVRDVPQACRRDGSAVVFRLTAHYDPKKKQDSQRAVQLSPA